MSESLPKYIKVKSLKEANENSELYSLRDKIVYTYQRITDNGVIGGIETDVEYLMGLREAGKYDDVEAFRRVAITDNWQEVPEGMRIIHHTSKEVIIVKVKQSEDDSN